MHRFGEVSSRVIDNSLNQSKNQQFIWWWWGIVNGYRWLCWCWFIWRGGQFYRMQLQFLKPSMPHINDFSLSSLLANSWHKFDPLSHIYLFIVFHSYTWVESSSTTLSYSAYSSHNSHRSYLSTLSSHTLLYPSFLSDTLSVSPCLPNHKAILSQNTIAGSLALAPSSLDSSNALLFL